MRDVHDIAIISTECSGQKVVERKKTNTEIKKGKEKQVLLFTMGRCVLILVVILALSGPFVTAQTTENTVTEVVTEVVTVVTEVVTVEDAVEDADPCVTNPCDGTAHTRCVKIDSSTHSCECVPGYSSNSQGVCTAAQSFSSGMTITQVDGATVTYSAALADPTTTEFQNLAASVEESIDTVYLASSLADIYLGSVVTGFSEGSVVADYIVNFMQEDTSAEPVTLNVTEITTAFTTALEEQVAAGNIDVTIDATSIVITDLDECASADDNDCHASATCTNTVGSFTCECSGDFIDVSPDLPDYPGRDCDAPPSLPPNTACLSNPCDGEHDYCVPANENDYRCLCEEGYVYNGYFDCVPPGRMTEFRCYTCHDEIENIRCNGRQESENGTAQWCPNPTDTCFQTIQMNPEGDGWMIRKGCMDKEECYDLFYSQGNDPAMETCTGFIWPYGPGTTPAGGLQCHYCCNENFPIDMCNEPSIGLYYESPPVNNWDPRMQWDLTMDYVTPTPQSAAVRQLSLGVAGILVSAILTIILH